jgi:hypothetical protein
MATTGWERRRRGLRADGGSGRGRRGYYRGEYSRRGQWNSRLNPDRPQIKTTRRMPPGDNGNPIPGVSQRDLMPF